MPTLPSLEESESTQTRHPDSLSFNYFWRLLAITDTVAKNGGANCAP